jgi:AraC family transcriptional regulator of adaptative response / DNA-3-methyladenine glycosylase II
MFDLDANPAVIAATLAQEPALATLLHRFPGVRSPVCWSVAEATVRAIVGQQVSTVAARTVCSRLAAAAAPEAGDTRAFPDPAAIAALADGHFPMPSRRRDTLRTVCQLLANGEEPTAAELLALPGIGPWTTAMVAMRGHGQPDAFPPRDLGLMRAWEALPEAAEPLHLASVRWQPWRAYAANLLWRSLGT